MQRSIATLKAGQSTTNDVREFIEALGNWRADKGYPKEVFEYWLKHQEREERLALETLLGRFLMRLPYDASSQAMHQAIGASLYTAPHPTYTGTQRENTEIDGAIADSSDENGFRRRIRHGATRHFSLEGFKIPSWAGIKTPILILGAGAAGILAARCLIDAGYSNIRVIDHTGEYGGIWRWPDVQQVRNNPFPFGYEDYRVEAAPGSGLAITQFLDKLVTPPPYTRQKALPPIIKGYIWRVEPGDLAHKVIYSDQQDDMHEITVPILINALGTGFPLPLSRPGVIETDVTDGGRRWQHHISVQEAERMRGKRIVCIGLGNSTMEMVVQLQNLNRAGYNIKYKIVTHYSFSSLRSPNYPDSDSRQVFRDISYPCLSRLAGDLEHIEQAYSQVWESTNEDLEEIISSVYHWTIEPEAGDDGSRIMSIQSNHSPYSHRFEFHELYSLIGYGYSPIEVGNWGLITTDTGTPAKIAHDFDGEFQKQPVQVGRERLYPGYFGLGSLLPLLNAQVIPGMLFRLPDLLVGVSLRTTEHILHSRLQKRRR